MRKHYVIASACLFVIAIIGLIFVVSKTMSEEQLSKFTNGFVYVMLNSVPGSSTSAPSTQPTTQQITIMAEKPTTEPTTQIATKPTSKPTTVATKPAEKPLPVATKPAEKPLPITTKPIERPTTVATTQNSSDKEWLLQKMDEYTKVYTAQLETFKKIRDLQLEEFKQNSEKKIQSVNAQNLSFQDRLNKLVEEVLCYKSEIEKLKAQIVALENKVAAQEVEIKAATQPTSRPAERRITDLNKLQNQPPHKFKLN